MGFEFFKKKYGLSPADRGCKGSEFCNLRAEREKALLPREERWTCGMEKRQVDEEGRDLSGSYCWKSSVKYETPR